MTDYEAALRGAALFDMSSAAKLRLTGPDAAMFLGNLCTNDIRNLLPGRGCPAFFCDARAKVQFQTWIFHIDPHHVEPPLADDGFWIETTPGRNEALFKYLDRYLISERVEITDVTTEYSQFHLAGPKSKDVLEAAIGSKFDLPEYGIIGQSVRRRDLLGVPGYDLVFPAADAHATRQRLLTAGAVPASAESFETLRIEAGLPLFGPDIDENRFVMEVGGAAKAVSYTKGCYLGQEPIVMARDRAGHVNRAFLSVKVLDGGSLPSGTKLLRDGQEVGVVTSSCHSPRLGVPIALAYLRFKHQDVGLRLETDSKQSVEVTNLPVS
jgi:folate-binding protein YgfZ